MPRKPPTPQEFAELLAVNEELMAEMAAFYVTCEQFEIEDVEGFALLAALPDDEEK